MITVCILINGSPIVARAAVNKKTKNKKGETKYWTDSGEIIWHKSEDGVVVLARKMLETIKDLG